MSVHEGKVNVARPDRDGDYDFTITWGDGAYLTIAELVKLRDDLSREINRVREETLPRCPDHLGEPRGPLPQLEGGLSWCVDGRHRVRTSDTLVAGAPDWLEVDPNYHVMWGDKRAAEEAALVDDPEAAEETVIARDTARGVGPAVEGGAG